MNRYRQGWAQVVTTYLILARLINSSIRSDEISGPVAPVYDCGTIALYEFLRLDGRAVELHELEAALPGPRPEGYSMNQLRDAARVRAVDLQGGVLSRQPQALDRPMIAYLKRGKHGHFVVVRPVGHSGTMVQVIDGANTPEVMDKAELFTSPEWTGAVLMPSLTDWRSRAAHALLTISCLLFLLLIVHRGRHWATSRLARRVLMSPDRHGLTEIVGAVPGAGRPPDSVRPSFQSIRTRE